MISGTGFDVNSPCSNTVIGIVFLKLIIAGLLNFKMSKFMALLIFQKKINGVSHQFFY
jgi:hypothetical protein